MTPRARQDIRESQVVPVSFMVVDHEFTHTLKNVSRVYVPSEAPMATRGLSREGQGEGLGHT